VKRTGELLSLQKIPNVVGSARKANIMWFATVTICTVLSMNDPNATCDPDKIFFKESSPPQYTSEQRCIAAAQQFVMATMPQLRAEGKIVQDGQYMVMMKCDENKDDAPPLTQELPEGHPSIDVPPLVGHKK
jgi:hypothetical protein